MILVCPSSLRTTETINMFNYTDLRRLAIKLSFYLHFVFYLLSPPKVFFRTSILDQYLQKGGSMVRFTWEVLNLHPPPWSVMNFKGSDSLALISLSVKKLL